MPSLRPVRLAAAASLAIAIVGQTPVAAVLAGAIQTASAPPPTVRSMPSAPSAAAAAAAIGWRLAQNPEEIAARTISASAEPHAAVRTPTSAARGADRPAPAASRSRHEPAKPQRTRAPAAVYRGTNHMWFPALGISRAVAWFPCSRSTAPGLAVYRWGCAGTNNVYLFAHAYAAFGPLHDAYVSGRLRRGMTVLYADGGGRVHTYAVAWWRLTTPDRGAFAYAAQRRPSLTLQTCVGSRSQYRLIVRLVRDS